MLPTFVPSSISYRSLSSVAERTGDLRNLFGSYSVEVAYEPERLLARTAPDFSPDNAVVSLMRDTAAIFTLGIGIFVGVLVVLLLLLSVLCSRLMHSSVSKEEAFSNRSTVYGGSQTAALSLWARSQMYLQGSGGPDVLAPLILERVSLVGPNVPGSRSLLSMCALLSRTNFQITRNMFEDQVSYISTLFNTGLITPIQVRTCFLDDCVETFLRHTAPHEQEGDSNNKTNEYDQPRVNVVILGAGYDSRCYRLGLLERGNINMFEVDAPGTQAEKKRILGEIKVDASRTIFCQCDFETADWFECLEHAGFDANLRTIFIWEGVSMYVSESVVRDTLEKVKKCNSKSVIGFDYVDSRWAMSPFWRGIMNYVREPFKFALTGYDEPENYIESCGLVVLEHLRDEKEMARRYLPLKTKERRVGIRGSYGGFVLAGVQS